MDRNNNKYLNEKVERRTANSAFCASVADGSPMNSGSLLGFGSGRSFSIWLFVLNFIFGNNIGQRFRADDFQIPKLRQALSVVRQQFAPHSFRQFY